jgi:MYXO-CTERM domain-containing protein
MLMRKAVFSIGLLLLMSLAPAAKAVPVEITYSVSSVITLPALATVLGTMSGTATIRYVGTGANGTTGIGGFVAPARVQSFNASGPLSFTVAALAPGTITGVATVSEGANSNGALAAPLGALTLPFAGPGGGFIHCFGPLCSHPLVAIPASVTIPISLVFNTVLSDATAVPSVGSILTLVGGFGTFGGVPLTATSTLTEISRTAVPEPGTASLVWLGLAGLAGARWHRRRRK